MRQPAVEGSPHHSPTGMRMEPADPLREHEETEWLWTHRSWSGGRAELGCAATRWKKAEPKSSSVCWALWDGERSA